jgi:hypothetical protein
MNEQSSLTPAAVILAAALLLSRGCSPADVGPQPGPTPPPEPVVSVRAAFDDYRILMADVWAEGAAMSARGEFESDRDARDWIGERAELARRAAFAPVHQREQDELGGEDQWSPERQATLWIQFETECR